MVICFGPLYDCLRVYFVCLLVCFVLFCFVFIVFAFFIFGFVVLVVVVFSVLICMINLSEKCFTSFSIDTKACAFL